MKSKAGLSKYSKVCLLAAIVAFSTALGLGYSYATLYPLCPNDIGQWVACPMAGGDRTITISSATLYSGTAASATKRASSNISLALNNPSSATTIASFTLSGSNLSTSITTWSTSPEITSEVNFANGYTSSGANSMKAGAVTTFTFFPIGNTGSESITVGQAFNYVLDFGDGESISGSLIAQ